MTAMSSTLFSARRDVPALYVALPPFSPGLGKSLLQCPNCFLRC